MIIPSRAEALTRPRYRLLDFERKGFGQKVLELARIATFDHSRRKQHDKEDELLELDEPCDLGHRIARRHDTTDRDRKSTRLNSSHSQISYAVFCLKKKNTSQQNRK